MRTPLTPVLHPSCGELPEKLVAHFARQASAMKRGARWTHLSRDASGALRTLYLTRGQGVDDRVSISAESGPMPAIQRPCRKARDEARPALSSDPSAWGPPKWREMEETALNPKLTHEQFVAYLNGIAASLPCPTCATHWRQLMRANPFPKDATFDDRFTHVWQQHNRVNASLGKPEMPLEEARRRHLLTEAQG